jgi:transposase
VHAKKCPCCKALNKGSFPQEITAPTQYGKRFDALIAYLSVHQMLPYERITQVMEDLFGHPIKTPTKYLNYAIISAWKKEMQEH